MILTEKYPQLPDEVKALPIADTLHFYALLSAELSAKIEEQVNTILSAAAEERHLSRDEFIQDVLWTNPSAYSVVFGDLITEGVPEQEIRKHVKLSDAVKTPDYEF